MNLQINLQFSGDCVQSEGVLAATDVVLMQVAVLAPKRISRAARTCLDNINCVGTPRVGSGVVFKEGSVSFNLHIFLEDGGSVPDAVKFKEALEVELGVRPRPVLPAPTLRTTVPRQMADLPSASKASEPGVRPNTDLAQQGQEAATDTGPLVESATHVSEKGWPEHAWELPAGDETPAKRDAPLSISAPLEAMAAGLGSPEPSHKDPVRQQPEEVEAPVVRPDTVMHDIVTSPRSDAAVPVEKESSEACSLTASLPIFVSGSAPAAAPAEIRPLAPADDLDQVSATVFDFDPEGAMPDFDPIKDGTNPGEVCPGAEVLSRNGPDDGLDASAARTSELSPRPIASQVVGADKEAAPTTEHLMRPHALQVPMGAMGEAGTASDACHDRGPARHDEVSVSDAADSRPGTPTPPPESLRLAPKVEMVTHIVVESCTAVTQAQLEGKGLPTLIVVVDPELEQVGRGMNFTSRLSGLETRQGGIFLLDAFEIEVD